MSGHTSDYCFRKMPAAVAYQLQLIYYQRKSEKIEKRFETDTDIVTAFFS